MRRGKWLVGFVLAGFILSRSAAAADLNIDHALQEKFNAILAKLDADDFRVRDHAADDIAALPPEVLPLVEEALRSRKLSPEVMHRLGGMIEDLRRNGAITVKTRQRQAKLDRYRDFVLQQYDTYGVRNPKWDAAVRSALSQHVAMTQLPGFGRKTLARTIDALQRCVDLGCTDPMLRLDLAIDRQRQKGQRFDQFDQVNVMTEDMLKSRYAASFKAWALVTRARSATTHWSIHQRNEGRDRFLADLNAAADLLPQLKGETKPSDDALLQLGYEIYALFDLTVDIRQFDAWRDRIAGQITLAEGDPLWGLLFAARADFLTSRNRSAQVRGEETSVNHAFASASKALELHPESVAAAAYRLKAAHVGDRERFAQCYKDVLSLDADNYEAHYEMAVHMSNYGSFEQLVAYADACIATKAWLEGTPIVAVYCLDAAFVKYPGDSAQFLSDPSIWDRIEAAYESTLAVRPEDNSLRSNYAFWAVRFEKWAIADRQFEILGDDVEVTMFGSDAKADYARRRAKRKTAESK